MLVLVHSSPTTLEPYRTPHLGVLSCPHRIYTNVEGWPWAADNRAFAGFDEQAYRAMLERVKTMTGCLFVTAPDVVGDAEATDRWWGEWFPIVRSTGHPVAYVTQDGCVSPPWDELGCLFVGGTDSFKLSEQSHHLVREAKRRGLWVHMGRVNGGRRMLLAKSWGVDSVDGTGASRFRDAELPGRLRQAEMPRQMNLLAEGARA